MKVLLRIVIVSCFLFGKQVVFAQQDKDRVEALRVAFISKRLELTTAESEKFWPLYNEYNDKVRALKKNLRQNYHAKGENATEKEAEDLYNLDLQSRQAETDLHKQYSEKIKAVIGVRKTIRLRLAEEYFKREIIKNIKERGE
jgi:hypothetical protein